MIRVNHNTSVGTATGRATRAGVSASAWCSRAPRAGLGRVSTAVRNGSPAHRSLGEAGGRTPSLAYNTPRLSFPMRYTNKSTGARLVPRPGPG